VSVLRVHDLRKTYVKGFFRKQVPALRGISFEVERGEVFGFLGPNGAGKTTAIRIVMGLIFATSGEATLFDRPIGDRQAKRRVGFLPEKPYFYDYLTASELLDMVGRLYGLDAATRRRRAAELLERVELGHAARRPMRSYSKGMMQRAGLAQALRGQPDRVVFDEPMSGLDPIGRKMVRELMLELRDQGTTVFFSTHILGDASMICDRVGILVQGTLRDVGPLGALLSPKVHHVDVVWRLDDAAAAAELRAAATAGRHQPTSEGEVYVAPDPDDAHAFVAAVVGAGGRVLQVTPHRQTLEELFVAEAQAVGRAAEGAEG